MNDGRAFVAGRLLLAIVPRRRGETVMEVAREAGAAGGTLLAARGTASAGWLRLLGLDDVGKDVALILGAAADIAAIQNALGRDGRLRKARGLSVCLDVAAMPARPQDLPDAAPAFSPSAAEDDVMHENAEHELVCVIVNDGLADEIMAAARDAGAPGGTVLNARGTGREDDARFFGITIVPEKEMVLMLAPRPQSRAILDAVCALPCLSQPGVGIAFCLAADSLVQLGEKRGRTGAPTHQDEEEDGGAGLR